MRLALLLVLSLASGCAGGEGDDTSRPDMVLSRLAFGSCSKPRWPQRLWPAIVAKRPQVWLWTGDAVYLDGDHPDLLAPAYDMQLVRPEYRALLDTGVVVDGVYDDHDYGRNDAGKKLHYKERSQQAFLDFIGVPPDAPRRSREGGYSSHSFGSGDKAVKVILLDTRYHRDDHVIPSIGGIRFPLSSLVACAVRWASVFSGIGWDFEGDILGEEQWAWLEERLKGSDAAVHVLISSIQVFTSNPLFESWAHFPRSKRRLLDLLKWHSPAGLVVVSGDVHHADLVGDPPIEVTSSGMTHTLSTMWYGWVLDEVAKAYSAHRRERDAILTEVNFGMLRFRWSSEGDAVGDTVGDAVGDTVGDAVVYDVEGRERLSMPIYKDPTRGLAAVERVRMWSVWEGVRGAHASPAVAALFWACALGVPVLVLRPWRRTPRWKGCAGRAACSTLQCDEALGPLEK